MHCCRIAVVVAVLAVGARTAQSQHSGEMDPATSARTASTSGTPASASDSLTRPHASATRTHVAPSPDSAYRDVDVDSIAIVAPGSPTPPYPDALAIAHIEGHVTARFIVGANGRVEPASIRIISTTNAVLSKVVRETLPSMRFEPAMLHGRTVRQVVEQPFSFTLP